MWFRLNVNKGCHLAVIANLGDNLEFMGIFAVGGGFQKQLFSHAVMQ